MVDFMLGEVCTFDKMSYQPPYTLSENAVSRIAEIATPRPVIYLMQETVRTVELDSSGRPIFSPDWPVGTIKARGVSKGGKKKVVSKGGKKTADRILELVRENPRITFAELVEALGISRSAIQKHVMHLKDAQFLRRIGPDKGGRWEVA